MAIHNYYPGTLHDYAFELNKDFVFSAAHFIDTDEAGKCRNMHGHNYTVNLTIVGQELDHNGFLVNFKDLKKLVHDRYDHTVLNESDEYDGDMHPSTEIVAATIYDIVQDHLKSLPNKPICVQVILRETDTSYVIFRPYSCGGLTEEADLDGLTEG